MHSQMTKSLAGEIMSLSTEANKKCRTDDDEDLISNLPESVICHILSRLPSKDAVRTSVLSKDWEHKWTTAYNVEIIDWAKYSKERRKKPIFYKFVNKMLLLSHDLKSVRFLCDRKYTVASLMNWISAALRRNIESLELKLLEDKNFVFPVWLLNGNTSLRTLKLKCTLQFPRDNYFPYLTDLYLQDVEILNDQSNSDQLVFTFNVLRTCELINCKWPNVKLVEIHSSALRTFKSGRPYTFCTQWKPEDSHYLIKICAARLDKFETFGWFPENIILHESTVRHAVLEYLTQRKYYVERGLQIRKLMKGFSNLAELELLSGLCEPIAQSLQEFPLPKFDRLIRLHMYINDNAVLLLELLHSAPSLRFLKLHGGAKEFDCVEVDTVPFCVTSHLEEVVFKGTSDNPLNHLANFFLKNGLELKKVYVESHYRRRYLQTQRNATIKRLQKFAKASSGAKICILESL